MVSQPGDCTSKRRGIDDGKYEGLEKKRYVVLYRHLDCTTSNTVGARTTVRKLTVINLLKPTGHVMHQQFNIQQLYALPTLYLCVLYLSENKQRLVPLTA